MDCCQVTIAGKSFEIVTETGTEYCQITITGKSFENVIETGMECKIIIYF